LAQSGRSPLEILRQSSQRPAVVEAQPVFDERGMRCLESGGQHLRVDCPQVLARTGAQRTGKANQIIRRSWCAARTLCCRSVGCLWGRCALDDPELRFCRSVAGKPAPKRADLTVFQWLPPVLFGGFSLCQACAAWRRRGWCHQSWRQDQRQEHENCQEGSHCYPTTLTATASFCPRQPADFRPDPTTGTGAIGAVNSMGNGKFPAHPRMPATNHVSAQGTQPQRRFAEAG
jgi:hypothetical protein